MPKSKPSNFAEFPGYCAPIFARPLLAALPSVHLHDQPPAFETLAGPYNSTEYKSALKAIQEYSRAGRALALTYTRTLIYICEDTSRELLAVETPQFPSSPVQSPVIPSPSPSWSLAPYVAPLLPPHHSFVDLLGGGASLLMVKPPSLVEIYNDRDAELANLFGVIRSKGAALSQLLALTPYQANQPRQAATETHHDPLERARRAVLRLAVIQDQKEWRTYQNALPGIIARLQNIEVHSTEPAALLKSHDRPGVHFHLDLPAAQSGFSLSLLDSLQFATVSILHSSPVGKAPGAALVKNARAHDIPGGEFVLSLISRAEEYTPTKKPLHRLPKTGVPKSAGEARKSKKARNFPARSETAEIRQGLNLSQSDFAELLGVPLGTLRKWEAGGTPPRPAQTLLKLARINPTALLNL